MNVIILLIAASAVVALFFLWLFIKTVKQGQFDDMWSPSRRMLMDDDPVTHDMKEGSAMPRPTKNENGREGK